MAVSASGIVDDLMKGFLAVQKYMSRPSGEKVGKVSSEEESHNSEHEKMVWSTMSATYTSDSVSNTSRRLLPAAWNAGIILLAENTMCLPSGWKEKYTLLEGMSSVFMSSNESSPLRLSTAPPPSPRTYIIERFAL